MPALYGALTALFLGLGLAAIPMLRDQGPVERLGGRIGGVREPEQRRSVLARLVNHLAGLFVASVLWTIAFVLIRRTTRVHV